MKNMNMNQYVEFATWVALVGLVIWITCVGWSYFGSAVILLLLVHGYLCLRDRLARPAEPSAFTTADFPPTA